jgi:hypothetical protein
MAGGTTTGTSSSTTTTTSLTPPVSGGSELVVAPQPTRLQLHVSHHRLSDRPHTWEVNCLSEATEWQVNVYLKHDENLTDCVKSVSGCILSLILSIFKDFSVYFGFLRISL